MHQLYQTFGAGDLKSNANTAFQMAESGPVVVLRKTQPAAVMINPDKWNDIAQELNDLRALVAALRAEQELSDPDAWTVEHAADPVPA